MPSDWIDTFMSLTETVRSPESFRLWTAITTIAATLVRRCWTVTDSPDPLYPNLYTILAGGPASGKTTMVNMSRKMLIPIVSPEGIALGPDNPSPASFMDCLYKSSKKSINGMGVPFYAAMYVLCTELGDLISKYDKDFAAKLTTLFDNPDHYSMPRRTSITVNIEAPCVNMLAAATPAALGDTIPESAWDQGFTSRMIFIYGTIPAMRRKIFTPYSGASIEELQKRLESFFKDLHGEFTWEPDAQTAMEYWFNDEMMYPKPDYGKLVNYNGRRDTHVMKLAMVSAVSSGNGLFVTFADFRRAQKWLFEAEKTMPDVFRAMVQVSDIQLLEDITFWMKGLYFTVAEEKRKAFNEKDLWKFLENKTPQEKIPGFIKTLEATGRVKRTSLGYYIPNSNVPTYGDQTPSFAPEEKGIEQ